MGEISLRYAIKFLSGSEPPVPVPEPEFINSVPTGDVVITTIFIIAALLCLVSVVALVFYRRRLKNFVNRPGNNEGKFSTYELQNTFQSKRAKIITTVFIISILLVSLFAGLKSFAFANLNSNVEETVINAYVNEQTGEITIDDATFTNPIDDKLIINNSSVTVMQESQDVPGVSQADFTINGLGETLFRGNPDGKKFIVDHNVRPLDIGESTVLSFKMSNLSVDSAKSLIGRDVFMINFGSWEQSPSLRFDASPGKFDDGSSIIDIQQTVYKNYVIPSDEPQLDHYTFAGWFSQPEGKGIEIVSTKPYEDINIDKAYAYWTPIEYSITATIQPGQIEWGTLENTCPDTVPYGTAISVSDNVISIEGYGTIIANPNSRTAQYTYGFQGWTNGSKTFVDGDIEFRASFTRTNNVYTLTLDNASATQEGSTAIYLKYNEGYYLDNACTKKMSTSTNAISLPQRNGYYFSGYSYSNIQFIDPSGYLIANASVVAFDFDTTFNASWNARLDTKYYVNHYKQNIDGTYPSVPSCTEEFQGETDTIVVPDTLSTEEGQDFYGFTAPSTTQLTITGDGLAYVDYRYTRNTYAVNFYNTPESIPTQYIKYEDKVVRPYNPYKVGYTFINWFKDQSHEIVWDFDNDIVSKATNIYADWNAKTYTIVSDKNGGEYIDAAPVISQTYTYDGAPLQTSSFTVPRLKGYTMAKWVGETSQDAITTIDKRNLALVGCDVDDESIQGKITANWVVKSYTVQLDSQGADISQGTTSFDIQYGDDLPSSITPPQKSNAEFLGYYGSISDPSSIKYFDNNGNSTGEKWWVDQENPVLYARWHMLGDTSYTVYHYKANIDGTYPEEPTDTQSAMGFDNDNVTPETMITVEGSAYYGFVAPDKQTITIHKGQTNEVKYYYERKKFNVTFITNIPGQNPIIKQVSYENKAQEELLTYTGYTNGGWYKNSLFTQPWNFDSDIVTADISLYAKWNANIYTIVADPSPGTFTGQQSPVIKLTYTYDSDSVNTSSLSIPLYSGYTFVKWLSTDKSKQILTIDKSNLSDVGCDVSNPSVEGSVKASYNANSYTVKFNSNGAQTGYVEDQNFVYNQKQNLHKNNFEKVGFEFAGWVTDTTHTEADYADEEEVQNLATSQGAIVNLYALWQKLPVNYTIKYYKQNIYNDDPASEPFKTDVKQAPAESYVTVSADGITGFETPSEQKDVYIKADGSTVIEFIYIRIKYSVTFDLQGHGDNIPDLVKYESMVSKPIDPTDNGYTFKGWYKEASCSTEWNFETDTIQGDTTIFAKWTANKYVIDADANGGSFSTGDTMSLSYTYMGTGVNTSSLSYPTKTGYSFVGWYTLAEEGSEVGYIDYTNLSIVGCEVTNPDKHGKVFAHWKANTYLIRADAQGGGYEHPSPITTIEYTYDSSEISTETALTTPSKTGYTFASWYNNTGSDGTKIEKINNDILTNIGCDINNPAQEGHLYAHWTAKTYTVKLNWMYEESAGTTKIEYINVTFGNVMPTITIPSRQGWQFDGFFNNQQFTGESFYNADGTSTKVWDIDQSGVELFAKWTNAPYLHYTVWHIKQAVDETYPTDDPAELEAWPSDLKHKEVLTIPIPGGQVTPSTYSGFGGYFDKPSTQTVDVTQDYATTVVYRYSRVDCTLYSVDDPDKPSEKTLRQTLKYQQKPTKPSPDPIKPGFRFIGWYKYNGDQWDWDNDIMYTNTGITIYAHFEIATYTINAYPNGGSFTGESPVTKLNYTYNADSVIIASIVSQPNKPGYTFGGWLDKDGNEITEVNTSNLEKCSIDISYPEIPGKISAKWIENQYSIKFNPNFGTGTAMPDEIFNYTESKALSKNTYTRSGYHFIGWAKSSTSTVIDFEDEQVVSKLLTEGSLILYALWEGNTYTINAVPDPGVFPVDSTPTTKVEYVYGTTKALDFTQPERTGYNFADWYTSGESPVKIEEITKDNLSLTGCNIDDPSVEGNLYAHWTAKTTTITFVCTEDESQNFTKMVTFDSQLPSIEKELFPTYPGKVFDGYVDNSLITPEAYYDKNGTPLKETWNIDSSEYTLTVKWIDGYQIIYKNKNDEDFPIELPEGSPTVYVPGQDSILPNLFEEGKPSEQRLWPGYIFKGWHFTSGCTDPVVDKISASYPITGQPITVYADWEGVKSKIKLYDEPSNKYRPENTYIATLYHKCGDPNFYTDYACEPNQVITQITPPTSSNWEYLNYLTTKAGEDYAFVSVSGELMGHKDIFPIEYKSDDEDTAYTIYANYNPGILEMKAYYMDKTNDISTPKPISNVKVVYQKYGIGWFSDAACTNKIYDLQSTFKNTEVPDQSNYNFTGLYDGLTKDTINIANTEKDEYGKYKFAFTDEEETYKKQSGIYYALYEGKIYPINLVKELEPWKTIYLKYYDGIYDSEACLTKIDQIDPPTMQYGTYTGFENGLSQQLINDQGVLNIDNRYLNDSNYLDENYSTLTATAIWSSKVYRVTYKSGSGTDDYANFYERYGVGFYKDEECTEKIDSIKDLPKPYVEGTQSHNQLIGLYQENDRPLVVNGKNVATSSNDEYKIVAKPTLEPNTQARPVYLDAKYIHEYKFDVTLKSKIPYESEKTIGTIYETIFYNTQGFYADSNRQNKITDTSTYIAPVPTDTSDEYIFDGYYSEQYGRGKKYFDCEGHLASGAKADLFEETPSIPTKLILHAYWKPKDFTIHFDNGDNVTKQYQTEIYGRVKSQYDTRFLQGFYRDNSYTEDVYMTKERNPISPPEKMGYKFGGYYYGNNQVIDDKGFVTNDDWTWAFSHNYTIYAKWIPNDITVSFYDEGREVDPSQIDVKYGELIGDMPVLSRKGYVFKGWWTRDLSSGAYVREYTSGDTVDFYDNITLFAKWENATYKIKAISYPGEFEEGVDDTITFTYGGASIYVNDVLFASKDDCYLKYWSNIQADNAQAIYEINNQTIEKICDINNPDKTGYLYAIWGDYQTVEISLYDSEESLEPSNSIYRRVPNEWFYTDAELTQKLTNESINRVKIPYSAENRFLGYDYVEYDESGAEILRKQVINQFGNLVDDAYSLADRVSCLYATWEANTDPLYKVTLDNDNADDIPGTDSIYLTYNKYYSLDSSATLIMKPDENNITIPQQSNYDFLGYFYKDENSDEKMLIDQNGYIVNQAEVCLVDIIGTKDIRVYAKYRGMEFEVTFQGTVDGDKIVKLHYLEPFGPLPTALYDPNWEEFDGWYKTSEFKDEDLISEETIVDFTDSRTIYKKLNPLFKPVELLGQNGDSDIVINTIYYNEKYKEYRLDKDNPETKMTESNNPIQIPQLIGLTFDGFSIHKESSEETQKLITSLGYLVNNWQELEWFNDSKGVYLDTNSTVFSISVKDSENQIVNTFYEKYDDGFYTDPSCTTPIDPTTQIVDIPASPDPQLYTFAGYYVDDSTDNDIFINYNGKLNCDISPKTFTSDNNSGLEPKFKEISSDPITITITDLISGETKQIYQKFGDGFYLDESCTKKMTPTKNSITPLSNTGYTFRGCEYVVNNNYYKIIDENGFITEKAYNYPGFVKNADIYDINEANRYTIIIQHSPEVPDPVYLEEIYNDGLYYKGKKVTENDNPVLEAVYIDKEEFKTVAGWYDSRDESRGLVLTIFGYLDPNFEPTLISDNNTPIYLSLDKSSVWSDAVHWYQININSNVAYDEEGDTDVWLRCTKSQWYDHCGYYHAYLDDDWKAITDKKYPIRSHKKNHYHCAGYFLNGYSPYHDGYPMVFTPEGYLAVNEWPETPEMDLSWLQMMLFGTINDGLNEVLEPDSYQINYLDGGSDTEFNGHFSGDYPTIHTYDSDTNLVQPSREDYTFDGWYLDKECTSYPIDKIDASMFSENEKINVYAKWTGIWQTINLDPTIGTLRSWKQIFQKPGDGIYQGKDWPGPMTPDSRNIDTPTAEYRIFEGYYYFDAAGAHKIIDSSGYLCEGVEPNLKPGPGESEITIYAAWEGESFKITLDNNGGSGGSSEIYCKYGDGYYSDEECLNKISSIEQLPTKSGYTFGGYITSNSVYPKHQRLCDSKGVLENTYTVYKPDDVKAYAAYVKPTYRFDLNTVYGDCHKGTSSIYEVLDEGLYMDSSFQHEVEKIDVPYKESFSFEGYYASFNFSEVCVINPDGTVNEDFKAGIYSTSDHITLTAKWAPIKPTTISIDSIRSSRTSTTHLASSTDTSTTFEVPADATRWEISYDRSKDNVETTIKFIVGADVIKTVTLISDNPSHSYIDNWTVADSGIVAASELTVNMDPVFYGRLYTYTMAELQAVSDDLSSKGENSDYWTEFNSYVDNAFHYTLDSNGNKIYDGADNGIPFTDYDNNIINPNANNLWSIDWYRRTYTENNYKGYDYDADYTSNYYYAMTFRIVGINQEVDGDYSQPKGITMMATRGWRQGFYDKDNYGSPWFKQSQESETWINWDSSTIEERLTELDDRAYLTGFPFFEARDNLNPVWKSYFRFYNSGQTKPETPINLVKGAYAWIPSIEELVGPNNGGLFNFDVKEGAGKSYNEQYQAFARAGYLANSNSKILANVLRDSAAEGIHGIWTRTRVPLVKQAYSLHPAGMYDQNTFVATDYVSSDQAILICFNI